MHRLVAMTVGQAFLEGRQQPLAVFLCQCSEGIDLIQIEAYFRIIIFQMERTAQFVGQAGGHHDTRCRAHCRPYLKVFRKVAGIFHGLVGGLEDHLLTPRYLVRLFRRIPELFGIKVIVGDKTGQAGMGFVLGCLVRIKIKIRVQALGGHFPDGIFF